MQNDESHVRLFPKVDCRCDAWLARHPGAWILDIGCGRCKRPGSAGIDPRRRRETAPASGFHLEHDLLVFRWPITDSPFDLVPCARLLEHLPPTVRLTETIDRVLKPGGQAFAVCPHFS